MLHGREEELERIESLLGEAKAERGGALVLRGPAGVGKSALLSTARKETADFKVLSAQGVEAESELPFAGLHQLLRPVLPLLSQLAWPQAQALRVAFGMERATSEDRFLASVATLSLLAEAAEQRPVLCVIDDTQWLDDASANALAFVARRLEADRIALLFAAREDDIRGFAAPGIPELVLGGLTQEASTALLEDRSGVQVPSGVCAQLYQATRGNPLALQELARALDPGALRGALPLPNPLPLTEGLERAFLHRVRRLPPETQELLVLAAAEDTGRLTVILAAAKELGLPDAMQMLRPAEEAGLVRVLEQSLAFGHPLVRSATYQGAPTVHRQKAHRALSRILTDPSDVDRRAWQRAAATSAPSQEVVRDLVDASDRARARGAFDAASAAMERAAGLTLTTEQQARLLAAAAENAWLSGQLRRASALLVTARQQTSDPMVRADIDRIRGSIEIGVGSVVKAKDILISATRSMAGIDSRRALRTLLLAAEAASYAADVATGIELGDLAGQIDPGRDPRDRLRASLVIGFGHYFATDLQVAIPTLRRAIPEAEKFNEPDLLAAAGRATMYVGDDEAGLRLHSKVVAPARVAGAVGDVLLSLQRIALVEAVTGRWSAATASGAEVLRLAHETGQHEIAALPSAHLTVIAAWRGDEDAYQSKSAHTRTILDDHPIAIGQDELNWARGAYELTAGRPHSAAEAFRAIRHPAIGNLALLDHMEALTQSGQTDLARAGLDRVEAFANHSGVPWAAGRSEHCQGLLAEGMAAADHFDRALAHYNEGQRVFERARCELAYGTSLRRARRRADARPHLRAALSVFQDLNAAPWAERARQELRASGENTRQTPQPTGVLTLTPQETQVARFVARGLPTREVAAQLFLSPRTVDYHLRKIFAKVGVTSRTELAQFSFE